MVDFISPRQNESDGRRGLMLQTHRHMELRIHLKKFALLARYYLRSAARRRTRLPFVFFLLSGLIFGIVFIPELASRIGQIGRMQRPSTLLLEGRIVATEATPAEQGSTFSQRPRCLEEATIEVGGFRSAAQLDGRYSIRFYSLRRSGIPVILRIAGRQLIYRVNYLPRQERAKLDLLVEYETSDC